MPSADYVFGGWASTAPTKSYDSNNKRRKTVNTIIIIIIINHHSLLVTGAAEERRSWGLQRQREEEREDGQLATSQGLLSAAAHLVDQLTEMFRVH